MNIIFNLNNSFFTEHKKLFLFFRCKPQNLFHSWIKVILAQDCIYWALSYFLRLFWYMATIIGYSVRDKLKFEISMLYMFLIYKLIRMSKAGPVNLLFLFLILGNLKDSLKYVHEWFHQDLAMQISLQVKAFSRYWFGILAILNYKLLSMFL